MSALQDRLVDITRQSQWEQPEILKLTDDADANRLDELVSHNKIANVYDPAEVISSELYEFHNPGVVLDDDSLRDLATTNKEDEAFGSWVYYPWSRDLVRFPDANDYHDLRTSRYRNLLTEDEIRKLTLARPAIFGLSVGSNIATALTRNSIGGEILLGDVASEKTSNIGRATIDIRDTLTDKVDAVAKQISYIDPYMRQTHFHDGINEDSIECLRAFNPTIIGDEVDDMRASALLREFSRDNHIAYVNVSDVHDTIVAEVCRHDLGYAPLYAGRVKDSEAKRAIEGGMSEKEQQELFIRTVGYTSLSPRLVSSGLEIGRTLGGIPQLGSTAIAGAGIATVLFRDISLSKTYVKTGITRSRLSPKAYPLDELVDVGCRYLRYMHDA